MLVCPKCGTVHSDPGDDPRKYVCIKCSSSGLYRKEDAESETIAGAILGGVIGGAVSGGAGALIGAILGGVIGNSRGTSQGKNK